MNLDKNGLPVQSDGNANDQLQRCGMIDTADMLEPFHGILTPEQIIIILKAIKGPLQPSPGTYVRYVGGATNTVSADQLISVLCAQLLYLDKTPVYAMINKCLMRFGFAQNTQDGLNSDTSWQIPDFMFFRAWPLFCRVSKWFYPAALIADIYLVIMAISAVLDRNPDDVDDNDTIMTFATCGYLYATPASMLAKWIYVKYRPINDGCTGTKYKPIYGALTWYHRAEAGGNPEIALMWKPIVDKYFGGSEYV